MLLIDYLLLILLSAIWGASFIFMRVLVPALGPVVTADLRMLIAGAALALFMRWTGRAMEWDRNWKRYIIIGLLNSGIPFLLFSYAALHLPASVSVIINSLTPLFGAVGAVFWLQERFTVPLALGLALGIAGVAIIRSGGSVEVNLMTTLSILMCVLATMFYAAGGIYVKKRAHDIGPAAIAAGSQLAVGILFLPLSVVFPMRQPIAWETAGLLIAFALFCSALAYIIYYRLMKILGPTKAATVTFLIPVFGFIWGALFLDESITLPMVLGGLVVLSGIYFVTGKRPTARS